jgi:uncharacterized membrane protein
VALIKNPLSLVLFVALTVATAFIFDPKLIAGLTHAVQKQQVPASLLAVFAAVATAIFLLVIYGTLILRYALRAQAVKASLLFFALTTAAAFFGYALRMSILPPEGVELHALRPDSYTLREGLVALIILTVTGTFFSTANNLAFLRKPDYSEFRAKCRDFAATVTAMGKTFVDEHVVPASDAKTAADHAAAALKALDKAADSDDRAYREFIHREIRPAVEKLSKYANDPQLRIAPYLLPRACGVIPPAAPPSAATIAEMSAAYRIMTSLEERWPSPGAASR